MAQCPKCNHNTLNAFRSASNPSVIAKCRTCGYYKQNKVKLNTIDLGRIVYNLHRCGLSFNRIALESDLPESVIEQAYKDEAIRRSSEDVTF
jgi:uncharacterized Zn finger protein